MRNEYYQAIDKLEKDGIAKEYILGWASGFLGNPKVEEQRITEAYAAGYGDGEEKNTDNAASWPQP